MRYVAPLVFLLLLRASTPALAEAILFDGKEFCGPVSGSGADVYVGLEALAQAMSASLHPVEGGWCLRAAAESGPCAARSRIAPGRVIVEGWQVESGTDARGNLMVRLRQAAPLLGAEVRLRQGRLEVLRAPAPSPTPAGPPGAAVDLRLVPGRTNLVLYVTGY